MASRDALMEARLRAARYHEEVSNSTEPTGELRPRTIRGQNLAGIVASNRDQIEARRFGSMVKIRHETPIITPLADVVQTNLSKVMNFFLPDALVPTPRDIGVELIDRYLEVDSMYLYIKASKHASKNDAVMYLRELDAAYDSNADMIILRHGKRNGRVISTMRFTCDSEDSRREWVKRLTGAEPPALEDSYVMVCHTLAPDYPAATTTTATQEMPPPHDSYPLQGATEDDDRPPPYVA